MSYALATERLNTLAAELHTPPGTPRRKFRLEDMRVLLAALGDPHHRFPSVLIAGTNGKGSTAATLASILHAAGYRTGLYTSPHLARPNERIQIATAPVADEDFAALYFEVEKAAEALLTSARLPSPPSFFEAITAMAFLHFSGWGASLNPRPLVDIAVLEVGLGGRLDATNVVEPLLSVITDISLDHTEWLGPTIGAIAREKAGILRPGGVMVTLPQHPEASQAIGEAAIALGVRAVNAALYLPQQDRPEHFTRNRYPLSVLGEDIVVDSPLPGQHQQRNIALAIAAAVELHHHLHESGEKRPSPKICNKHSVTSASSSPRQATSNSPREQICNSSSYVITAGAIEQGIRNTRWPGRLEFVRRSGGNTSAEVLLDVAHNPAGAWALRSAISRLLEERRRALTLIFGCLKDKAIDEMAQIMFPLFDELVLVEVDSPRAASLDQMVGAAAKTGSKPHTATDAAEALDVAARLTPQDGTIVVAGSVYLVGALRQILVPPAPAAIPSPSRAHTDQEVAALGIGNEPWKQRERVR